MTAFLLTPQFCLLWPVTYFIRRARDAFKEHKSAQPEEVEGLMNKAQHNLEVIKRQATISQMYADRPVIVEEKNWTH